MNTKDKSKLNGKDLISIGILPPYISSSIFSLRRLWALFRWLT